jgi:hypothetical protein
MLRCLFNKNAHFNAPSIENLTLYVKPQRIMSNELKVRQNPINYIILHIFSHCFISILAALNP